MRSKGDGVCRHGRNARGTMIVGYGIKVPFVWARFYLFCLFRELLA